MGIVAASVSSQVSLTLCGLKTNSCMTLMEEQWSFWDLPAIGSDRDEEGKSSLSFTNMGNYTEQKAVERLRKFSGSLGNFPNF